MTYINFILSSVLLENLHRAAIAEKEDAVRSRLDTVTELSAKLTESLRANTGEEVTYYLVRTALSSVE